MRLTRTQTAFEMMDILTTLTSAYQFGWKSKCNLYNNGEFLSKLIIFVMVIQMRLMLPPVQLTLFYGSFDFYEAERNFQLFSSFPHLFGIFYRAVKIPEREKEKIFNFKHHQDSQNSRHWPKLRNGFFEAPFQLNLKFFKK